MEIPAEVIGGIVLALLGGGGTAAVVRHRLNGGPSSRGSGPPGDVVAQQVAEIHKIVALRDAQDASVLLRSLNDTSENTRVMAATLRRIEEALTQRPRLPSAPDPAE
jgi:hypothetical protein